MNSFWNKKFYDLIKSNKEYILYINRIIKCHSLTCFTRKILLLKIWVYYSLNYPLKCHLKMKLFEDGIKTNYEIRLYLFLNFNLNKVCGTFEVQTAIQFMALKMISNYQQTVLLNQWFKTERKRCNVFNIIFLK